MMVKHFNECNYCGLIDNRGLYSPMSPGAKSLCRDCYDTIPSYIQHSQWNRFLKAKVKNRREAGEFEIRTIKV